LKKSKGKKKKKKKKKTRSDGKQRTTKNP
jgi:hypothetical protein